MVPVVKVHRGQLDYFRKLSRAAVPREIEAVLIGAVDSPLLVRIDRFVHPKEYVSSKPTEVQWTQEEWDGVVDQATKSGRRVVGNIHSHPSWDAVLSPTDHRVHIELGFRISGLCSTMTKPDGKVITRVRFWLAESSLPCKVEYL